MLWFELAALILFILLVLSGLLYSRNIRNFTLFAARDTRVVGIDDIPPTYVTVPILYGTDRRRTGQEEPNEYYGDAQGDFEFGMCEVSIPYKHTMGEIERPTWWRLEFEENPESHVVLLSILPLTENEFENAVSISVKESRGKDAFIFVHGFNVTFAEAARRTAQLAYDLGFDGAPILYSWPSRATVAGYVGDQDDAELTAGNLRRFLKQIAFYSGARRVHLIAHSMGNRALTYALRELEPRPNTLPLFNQIILTAPDIDARIFKEQIAPAIAGMSERVTLYASSNDKALALSKKIRGDYPRAGESGDAIVVLNGMDTIDASDVRTDWLGHGYFAETAPLINDIFLLLRLGLAPENRNLRPKQKNDMTYWSFPRSK